MAKDKSYMSVMPKRLAQALIEAGVQHYATGGEAEPQTMGPQYTGSSNSREPGGAGGAGGLGINSVGDFYAGFVNPERMGNFGNQVLNSFSDGIKGIGQAFTTTNDYQARAPTVLGQDYGFIQGLMDQNQAVYNNQDMLGRQLWNQSQGYGPNVAQNQLAQNTGQNIAAQQALMASQRGGSSNVGLLARQAAQQGAQTQQNAVGQAATLGAQQQINAQQQLQNLLANQGANALQGQSIGQGALAAQNSTMTTGQLGAQQINANVAGQNASAQNQTTGGIMGALGGGGISSLLGYEGGDVTTHGISKYDTPEAPNYGLKNYGTPVNVNSSQKSSEIGKTLGSYLKKTYGNNSSAPTAQPVQNFAIGGNVMDPGIDDIDTSMGTDSGIGALHSEDTSESSSPLMGLQNFGGGTGPGGGATASMGAGGVGAWAPKKEGGGGGLGSMVGMLAMLNKGGSMPPVQTHLLNGGKVKGKAQVKGDHVKNDTQPALLSAGEIVLPRSVAMAKNAPEKAAEFVRHLQAKKRGGYGDVVEAKKSLKDRVAHLEALCMGGKA